MLRHWRVLLLYFLAAAYAIWIRWWASSGFPLEHKICEAGEAANNCDSYNILFYSAWQIAKAVDHWSALITALATIAIAMFTLILYNATKGLVEAAKVQSADMKQSIEVSRISAEAAKVTADAAEKTLFVTYRPLITIVDFVLKDGDEHSDHKAHIQWAMRNSGGGIAIVNKFAVATTVRVWRSLTKLERINSFAETNWNGVIEAGDKSGVNRITSASLVENLENIRNGKVNLFVNIEIIGQDFFHNRLHQNFPFEFDHKIGAFMRVTGAEPAPISEQESDYESP